MQKTFQTIVCKCSVGILFRAKTLSESLRHFSGFAVGETAASLSEAKVECGGGKHPPPFRVGSFTNVKPYPSYNTAKIVARPLLEATRWGVVDR